MKNAVYFKLIRWKNLLLIIYIFLLTKFLLFPSFLIEGTLSTFSFIILLTSIVLITAAGYSIKAIESIISDKINTPKKLIVSKIISKEKALQWYKTTNALGITFGIIFCLKIEKPTLSFIFIGIPLLHYFYAKKFKYKPLIGNLIAAFLIAFNSIILAIFELDFSINNENQKIILNTIVLLSIFTFCIHLIRELIKDIETTNGDYALKMKTLPIILGIKRTKNSVLLFSNFPICIVLIILLNYSEIYKFTMLYVLIVVFLPLLFSILKLFSVEKKNDFKKINTLLKATVFLAFTSLIIFSITH
ncbi:UbiA family prenyltransferase [Lutibacter sp. A64]|uniref:UbiA family prenyltransferase n=1 Tax=Lutibacter sp. A64 TaxID=2918526 RepID=UPI001F06F1E0|nr:UbiA family prenyltransferase [Lutibacter sp. A64]UMB54456.1 UbiA family prenyltransferase [Lutibacter sp. A64]